MLLIHRAKRNMNSLSSKRCQAKALMDKFSLSHSQSSHLIPSCSTQIMTDCNLNSQRSNSMGTPNHAFSDHIISKITDLAFIQNQHWVSMSGTGNTKDSKKQSIPSCSLIHAPCLILNPKALALKYLLRWIKCPPWKSNKGPSLFAVIEAK